MVCLSSENYSRAGVGIFIEVGIFSNFSSSDKNSEVHKPSDITKKVLLDGAETPQAEDPEKALDRKIEHYNNLNTFLKIGPPVVGIGVGAALIIAGIIGAVALTIFLAPAGAVLGWIAVAGYFSGLAIGCGFLGGTGAAKVTNEVSNYLQNKLRENFPIAHIYDEAKLVEDLQNPMHLLNMPPSIRELTLAFKEKYQNVQKESVQQIEKLNQDLSESSRKEKELQMEKLRTELEKELIKNSWMTNQSIYNNFIRQKLEKKFEQINLQQLPTNVSTSLKCNLDLWNEKVIALKAEQENQKELKSQIRKINSDTKTNLTKLHIQFVAEFEQTSYNIYTRNTMKEAQQEIKPKNFYVRDLKKDSQERKRLERLEAIIKQPKGSSYRC